MGDLYNYDDEDPFDALAAEPRSYVATLTPDAGHDVVQAVSVLVTLWPSGAVQIATRPADTLRHVTWSVPADATAAP